MNTNESGLCGDLWAFVGGKVFQIFYVYHCYYEYSKITGR